MKQKLISSPYAWFLLDFCGLDVWIQWNEFIPSPNGGIGATLTKTVIFFCEHFWKTEYEKVPSCHAVVDFFVRNCLLYENSSKNVDFHVPSCSGSHPGWFHLAWGSNDGIWYRCRPPSANECSFSALARHQPRNPWKCQQLALYHHQRHQQLYINNEREQLSNRTVFQAVINIDQPFVLGLSSQLQ